MNGPVGILAIVATIGLSWPDFIRLFDSGFEQTRSDLLSVSLAAAVHLAPIGYAFRLMGPRLGLTICAAGMAAALLFRLRKIPVPARLLLAWVAFAAVQVTGEAMPA